MTLCAGIVALATLLLIPHVALAQATLGPGPKVSIQLVGHPIPTHPQWSKVDLVYYKELIPQRSGNRVEVKGATWAEMNIKGDEIIRMARQGQIDIGAASLTYLAGDVPLLDVADLAGLNPTVEQARKVADAVVATVNKELERFGVRIIASFPSPAQVFFCKGPVKDMADLKGRKVRTFGTSLNDLVSAIGATPVSITFAEVYGALERGVADCAITGTGSGNAAKWYEVTCDLLLTPQTQVAAWSAEPGPDQGPKTIGGRPTPSLYDRLAFTFPFNLTGHPAASVPCGFTSQGLPVGLQIVGRWHADATVLRAAAGFEAIQPWAHMRPPLA